MTIQDALRKFAKIEIELLLGHVLKQSKEFLYLHPSGQLTKSQQQRLTKLVRKRNTGIPIAYLLGYKDFYGLRFKITRTTLIPRPESEWLVDKALSIIRANEVSRETSSRLRSKSNIQILDIGTGSGCLAISIKKSYPKAKLTATDISASALTVAKQNAAQHRAKIKFKKQNLLRDDKTSYDLIIANLPYVPAKDYKKLKANLKFEPKSALVDPMADFYLYQQLLTQSQAHLTKHGTMLMEIDPTMKPLIEKWCKKNMSRAKLTFTRDINGFWRYCELVV